MAGSADRKNLRRVCAMQASGVKMPAGCRQFEKKWAI
jgi:hypothetical protein